MEPSERDIAEAIQAAWEAERPGLPLQSIGVITRLWSIAKLLSDDRRRTMKRLGMDAATRDLLATLRRSGPPYRLPAGEIARRALVSPGAISQRAARAERDGYVRRVREGRHVLVELTPAGRAHIDHSVADLLRHEDALFDDLSPQEREELAALLRKLLAGLQARASRSGFT